MDRHTLRDLGESHGAMRREGSHPEEEDGENETNFLRSTRSPRRIHTGNRNTAEAARYGQDLDLARDGSFDDGVNSTVGLTSSWEEQSDDEHTHDHTHARRIASRDRRKFTDATTPTLEDEEDLGDVEEEEQEMVSLAGERQHHLQVGLPERAFFAKDEEATSLRRTPGAQMYKSTLDTQGMRRTPGATLMHRSAVATGIDIDIGIDMQQTPASSDASGLGFGLTLSTPVAVAAAASDRAKGIKGVAIDWEAEVSSSSPADAPLPDQKSQIGTQVNRPPLAPGSGSASASANANASREQRGAFVSPWSLSKNAHLDSGRGVYSPNTLRLTEDLGNLLLEDDDAVDESSRRVDKPVFGAEIATKEPSATDAKPESNESWTAPYVISMDAPTRVPRGGTGRRGRKSETGRRARGYNQPPASRQLEEQQGTAKTGGFLPYAQQPKPVRNMQPGFGSFGNQQFTFGEPARPSSGTYGADEEEERASPRLLNFGGAFAPPAKGGYAGSSFRRPVPSAASTDPTAGSFTPTQQHDPSNQPSFPVGSQPAFPLGNPVFGATGFHNPFQPPPQPFGLHGAPKFQQPQFPSQDAMFGNIPTMSQSPTFNFQAPNVGPYPMHPGGMHPPPQNFMPNMPVHPHQQPQVPQFGPPNMPVHPHQQPQVPQFGPPQLWPQAAMPMHYDRPPMEQPNWHGAMGGWPTGEYGYGMPPPVHGDPRMGMAPMPTWQPETEHAAPDMSTNPFHMLVNSGMQSIAPQAAWNQNRGKNQRKSGSKKGTRNQSKHNDQGQKIESSNQAAFTGKKAPTTSTKSKKKQAKDRATPPARATPTTSGNEDNTVSTGDDPTDAKRAELVESPAIRTAFKDFYRKFRAEERTSFQDAEGFAIQALGDGSLPETVHWRVYIELADLAKRANRFVEARSLYQQVCRLQPYASQGWLEYSKLEEECGNMNICAKILRAGLGYCEYSENLLTRAIKHEEKMGNLGRARELLARLKHVGIEKVWRTVLEGALLEARAGNDVMARRVLKYLMHHVPWYGPLYLEAYRLERDLGRSKEALVVVERGLAAIPRYGPLWFGAFRLCEAMDHDAQAYHLPQSMAMIDRATDSISKELIWKVHLEAAQMLERASVEYLDESTDPTFDSIMAVCRQRFAMTILTCPPNLRWKVWLASGRMEVAAGKSDVARSLFLRAHQAVPDKGRAVALLECARLEEFVGDTKLASAILCKSRTVSGSDWKVWLESVLLEIHEGNYSRAIELAQLALQTHSGTGRLWASLVQLRHFDGGEKAQFNSLKQALNAVPKSGEVWCEGARIHLNPFSHTFDLDRARRHLFFATKFTPQYGDGFLETLRLELLDQFLVPLATKIWESTRKRFPVNVDSDKDDLVKYVFKISRAIFALTRMDQADESRNERLPEAAAGLIDKDLAAEIRKRFDPKTRDGMLDIDKLQLRCANADPNYGLLWFHCRVGPTDTARKVLARSLQIMFTEMRRHANMYLAALIRRSAVVAVYLRNRELGHSTIGSNKAAGVDDSAQLEEGIDKALFSAPSLKAIIEAGNRKYNNVTGMDLLESTMTGSDFTTGLVELSRHRPMEKMSLSERRKALFGTDALFS
jgi:tetratricopeptide (TPR) repeat protein